VWRSFTKLTDADGGRRRGLVALWVADEDLGEGRERLESLLL
jgi:hypothetical protein